MKNLLNFGVALLLIFNLNACYLQDFNCVKGSGATVEEEKVFDEDIRTISSSLSADVYVSQGATQKVIIKAQQNIIDVTNARVVGGELILDLSGKCIRNANIEVFVTTPTIEKVTLAGAGKIIGQALWNSPNLEVVVSGAGKVNAEVKSTNLNTTVSGAGEINLTGEAESQNVGISGAGNYKAFGLVSQKATVNVSGAGNCELWAAQHLDANISGSGNVKYKGDPAITKKISGVGNLKKIK